MRSLAALSLTAAVLLATAPARADSPNWRPAAGAFETMKEKKVLGVFWFHGDSLFHNSLSHKFHQKEVVALLRSVYCVQIPVDGGRSGAEQPIAQRFGIGKTIGTIVVCTWDGEELTRYGDIVETRHFVPIVKDWLAANARKQRLTEKAAKTLEDARKLLSQDKVKLSVLKLSQVIAKEGRISADVSRDAESLRVRVLARLDGDLRAAARLRDGGDARGARRKVDDLRVAYGRLPAAEERLEAFEDGTWTAGAPSAPPAAAPRPGNPGPPSVPAGAPRPAPQASGAVRVRFSLHPGSGSRVELAGTMNGWQPSPAWALSDPDGDGRFEGEFELQPGRYLYKFVVDGSRWLHDPNNPATEDDGHQGHNSVLDVGPGGAEPGAPSAADRPQTGGDHGEAAAGDPFGSKTRTRSKAFVGEIYLVEPGTQQLPDFRGPSEGKIYAESLNVAPRSFSDGFPGLTDRFEWFAIRYKGDFEAPKTGVYTFRLLSDDGSRLWINGNLAIDNGGLHEPRSISQKVRLKKGMHQLTIDYMQGPALDVALQLFVQEPTSSSEILVKAATVPRR
jgi:hypothetical protein